MAESEPHWYDSLKASQWAINGYPAKTKYVQHIWPRLKWAEAWPDAGPSPAGNLGPYWHVPWETEEGHELVARLYPILPDRLVLPIYEATRRLVAPSIAAPGQEGTEG